MSKLLYNGVELPKVPAHDADATVEVISAVLPAALSMYAQSPYILVIGKGTLWQGGKCYVRGVSAVYRLSGDAWMWHYGSGTVSTQDIVAANYFEAIWTNTDIPTADGAGIYLAASVPVDPNAPDEPEPEEPPVEPNVDVAAIYRRGWMDGFLSGINIRGILRRRKVEEPQPVTAYLYGTPSPTIVTYNGVELPELPEWDKAAFPYAYLNKRTDGNYSFLVTTKAMQYGTYSTNNTTYTRTHIMIDAGGIEKGIMWILSGSAWGSGSEAKWDYTTSSIPSAVHINGNIFWSNTDIPNIDNNTTYLAASKPVYSQVGGNVALEDGEGYVRYDGAVLPPLPESDLQYAVIYHPWATMPNDYILVFLSERPYFRLKNGSVPQGIAAALPRSYEQYRYTIGTGTGWKADGAGEQGILASSLVCSEQYFKWANCDILNEDGSVYQATSDPIPLASDEPVAAVYGGVRLPDIETVWTDKATYPFAFVYSFTNNGVANYILMLLPQVPYVGYLSSSTVRLDGCAVSATPHLKQYKSVAGVWEDQNFGYATASLEYYPASTPIIWASGDLAKTDGTVYLAASEPVNIYEKKE